MWIKGNTFALLVGMQTGTATVERHMEILQKIKNGSAFQPSDLTACSISKTLIQKNIGTSMFIAALCTNNQIWKWPKCPSVDEWIKQLCNIYTTEYYLATKKKKI